MHDTTTETVPADAADRIERVARILYESRVNREPLGPLPPQMLPVDAAEAQLIDDRVAQIGGWPLKGWKVGCTSEHAQKLLGSTGPFSGRVYTVLDGPATLGPGQVMIEPLLEGEIAFRLGRDLPPSDAPADRETVAGAVAATIPAIEVVGGRFLEFPGSSINCLVADAGSNALLVLGQPVTDVDLERLDEVAATMTIDGQVTGSGVGADVLGHPLQALVWLVQHLWDRGIGLEAGHVISTGTATQLSPLPAGSSATAELVGIGSVSLSRP